MSTNNRSLKRPPLKSPNTSVTEKSHILKNPKAQQKEAADKGVSSRAHQKGQKNSNGVSADARSQSNNPADGRSLETSSESSIVTTPQQNNDMSQLVQEMDMEGQEGIDPAKSSMAHASFNYINSILGSGVIGMPYALHQAGVGLGLVLMIFVAWITDYSLVLMVRGGQLSGSYTYQGMMEAAFGRWGFYVLSVLQLVYPLIAMISYNIIVGDTLTKVLVYFSTMRSDMETLEFQREAVVLAATLFVTLPLSLYRNVARMSKVSFLSLVSIGFIMLSILIRLGGSTIPATPDAWRFANTGVIQAIGVFAFAFMCHHNTFMIFSSMRNTNESKWSKVTHISIGTSLLVSLVFSVGGYATFTGNVQGDLLENYCWDDNLINVSRLLFCITILLTFPLECFVVRDVIENLFFKAKQPSTTSRHFSVTLIIVLAAYVISISTDCLGIVLELNGVLAAMPLAYILPSLCYIRLEPSRLFSKAKLPAIGIALFGTTISVVGLILLIVNGHSSGNCSHGQPLAYCTQPNFSNGSIFLTAPPEMSGNVVNQSIPIASQQPHFIPSGI